jgi:DNA (cytosine-5)-methyltransferase 1
VTAYYNENDPKAAAWLRELIRAGLIAAGDVDERSIEDVAPADLAGYTQCHFFAGIGGWSYALRLAGWPDDRPVWTGSCPCQPFSAAGKGAGFADERHLWPAFHWLIQQCRPDYVFGEQVANSLQWLDLVSTDLEAEGYAFGATVLGAHSVGAPHIRQRLYWVGHANSEGSQGRGERRDSSGQRTVGTAGVARGLADSDTAGFGLERRAGLLDGERQTQRDDANGRGSPWSACDWLPCLDGKARPVEPGTFPLAHGVPERVGLLRHYGNAIVAPLAAKFIEAVIYARA